jgi:hypothetical protein
VQLENYWPLFFSTQSSDQQPNQLNIQHESMVGCFGVGNQNTVPGKPFAENPVAHLTNLHFTFPFPMQQVLPFMARPTLASNFSSHTES